MDKNLLMYYDINIDTDNFNQITMDEESTVINYDDISNNYLELQRSYYIKLSLYIIILTIIIIVFLIIFNI